MGIRARGLARGTKRQLHEPADKAAIRAMVLVEHGKIDRTEPAELDVLRELEARLSEGARDVHPEVEQVAGALTPVPGGVGPLTIAMLLKNTVRAAQERRRAR